MSQGNYIQGMLKSEANYLRSLGVALLPTSVHSLDEVTLVSQTLLRYQ
jgi:hypothetical protein